MPDDPAGEDAELAAVLAEIDADIAERAARLAEKRKRDWRMEKRRQRLRRRQGVPPRKTGRPRKGADPLPEPEAQMGRPPGLERLGVNVSLRRFYPCNPAPVVQAPSAAAPVQRVPGKPGRPRAEIDLARLRELAALGLAMKHAAARLGVGESTLQTRIANDPDARAAWEDGAAELVEIAARKMREAVEAGNLQAVAFVLRVRGEWTPPKEPQAPPVVTVNVGSLPAPVSSANAERLLADQRRYLEESHCRTIEGKAEPV